MDGKYKRYLLPVALFLLVAAVRSLHPSADPPADLSWSGALFTDEGLWSHNAVNKALYGKWTIDEFNPMFFAPLFTLFQFIAFKLFGVSLISARLASLFFGTLTPVVLWAALKDWFKKETVPLASLLLGLNYVFVMYNRLALLETSMVFFLVLVLYFWQRGIRGGNSNFFFAGVAMLAAFLIKPTSLFLVPAYLSACFVAGFTKSGKKKLKSIAYFILGISLPLAFGIFYWVATHYASWSSCNLRYYPQVFSLSPLEHTQYIVTFFGSSFFCKMPVISLLAFTFLAITLYPFSPGPSSEKKRKKSNAIEVFAMSWIIFACAMVAFFPYQPTRYFLALLPPMCIAASALIENSNRQFIVLNPRWRTLLYVWFCVGVLNLAVTFRLLRALGLISITELEKSRSNFTLAYIASMAAIIAVSSFLHHLFVEKKITIPRKTVSAFLTALVLLSLAINGIQYLRWASNPEYSLLDAAKRVKSSLGKDAILTGDMACTLTLENHVPALSVFVNMNTQRVRKQGISHVILFAGKKNWRYWFYAPCDNAVLVMKFKVMKSYYRTRISHYEPDCHYLYRLLPDHE